MTHPFEGKIGLVVGGGGGIGRAVAETLSNQGVEVHFTSRSKDKAGDIASQIGGFGHVLDFRAPDTLESSLESLLESLGGSPDILVNAAGIFSLDPITETSLEVFRESLTVNLEGPFAVIRCFLPDMVSRGSGLIINIGSVAGRMAYPGNVSYSAAKYGLRGVHEVLIEETRKTGVRASLLEPSATSTTLWNSIDPDGDDKLPSLSEMLLPSDVPQSVAFLCSRPASVHIPVLAIGSS